jgi:RNA polymerase primary sigma factor
MLDGLGDLPGLTPREAKIVRMHFGIEVNTEYTLDEIGRCFDVTRERIRQIEAKALRKFKHPDRRRVLDPLVEDESRRGGLKNRRSPGPWPK